VGTIASLRQSLGTQPEGPKHGAFFAVRVQILLSITRVAVQGLWGAGN